VVRTNLIRVKLGSIYGHSERATMNKVGIAHAGREPMRHRLRARRRPVAAIPSVVVRFPLRGLTHGPTAGVRWGH
jgi:hypothetical protein